MAIISSKGAIVKKNRAGPAIGYQERNGCDSLGVLFEKSARYQDYRQFARYVGNWPSRARGVEGNPDTNLMAQCDFLSWRERAPISSRAAGIS